MLGCDRAERRHICRGAAHVHRQQRAGVRRQLLDDVGRVECERVVHLGQYRHGAGGQNGVRGCVPGVRGDDHLVAGPDTRSDEPADQGRRSRVHAECAASSHVCRELPLEVVDLVRRLADAVVAKEVLGSDHARRRLELLGADLHPAGVHGVLGPGSRSRAAVTGEPQVEVCLRHGSILVFPGASRSASSAST